MPEIPGLVLDTFDLSGAEEGEVSVRCPFHEDKHPSASVNMDKGVFFCHSCHRGLTFKQLEQELDQMCGDPVFPPADTEHHEETTAEQYLLSRGFHSSTDLGVDVSVQGDYLMFGNVQGRRLKGEGPKYLNEKGEKGLMWFGPRPQSTNDSVWLVEGVFDAMSLHQILPNQAIACSFGSHLSEQQAYELVGLTVFIAYDADFAGWKGARQARKQLAEFEANGIVLGFPCELGNDINEAWIHNRDGLKAWVFDILSEYSTKDDAYVARVFRGFGEQDMLTVSTGLGHLDDMFNGGFRPGVHVWAAESGIGKSSFAVAFAVRAAQSGLRVLYVTNEIPKRQVWSRAAANLDGTKAWSEIEANPRCVSGQVADKLSRLANNLRVVAGWNVGQIKYVAGNFDVIVVDYLQRMGGPYKGEAVKANIDYNIAELSDLGRDHGKVVIAVSSLNRVGYADMTKAALKESGNIEYVSQSIIGLKRAQGSERVMGLVLKNTRGAEGVFWMRLDLAHQTYAESVPGEEQQKPRDGRVNTEVLQNVG